MFFAIRLFWIYLLSIFQSTIFQHIKIMNLNPNLPFIAILLFSIGKSKIKTVLLGFFGGLILDFLEGNVIGINAASCLLSILILNLLLKTSKVNFFLFFSYIFIVSVFNLLFSYGILLIFNYFNFKMWDIKIIFLESIFNTILGSLLYFKVKNNIKKIF